MHAGIHGIFEASQCHQCYAGIFLLEKFAEALPQMSEILISARFQMQATALKGRDVQQLQQKSAVWKLMSRNYHKQPSSEPVESSDEVWRQ